MTFSRARLFGAMLMIGIVSIIAPSMASAETGRSGWYVGGGIGANWTSRMEQVGWNRETYCYPDACDQPGLSKDIQGVSIPGYRWMYDLDVEAGSAFEISVGRMFNRWRLEISAAQRTNDVEQQFRGITYLDGTSPIHPSQGNRVTSNSMARIDDLTTRVLSLNAYYDFTNVFARITPYLGVGLGVAFVEISGLHFSTDYQDLSDPSRDLSFYNSRQDVDLSDTVFMGNVYAGTDYSLTDETLLGVKLTYSMMDDVDATGRYSTHPAHREDPGFINHNTFSGPRQFSVMFTMKYLLSD